MPKVADTLWLSLGRVCKWFCKHRANIQEYINEKSPLCRPPNHWRIYVATCEAIIREINVAFGSGQGLTTLVVVQQKYLDKLKRKLLEVVGGCQVIFEEPDDENNYIEGKFIVMKESAIGMIKDCILYYQNLFEEASAVIQKDIWQDVSKFVLSIVKGVEEIEQQNNTSSGYKTPPALPCELVRLCSHQFNKIVNEQTRQFLLSKTKDDLVIIQQEHHELLRAYWSEEALRDAINALTNGFSFNHGWVCVGHGQFENMKEFCGGLAIVFPGMATVESNFSIVNYEKNEYRWP